MKKFWKKIDNIVNGVVENTNIVDKEDFKQDLYVKVLEVLKRSGAIDTNFFHTCLKNYKIDVERKRSSKQRTNGFYYGYFVPDPINIIQMSELREEVMKWTRKQEKSTQNIIQYLMDPPSSLHKKWKQNCKNRTPYSNRESVPLTIIDKSLNLPIGRTQRVLEKLRLHLTTVGYNIILKKSKYKRKYLWYLKEE